MGTSLLADHPDLIGNWYVAKPATSKWLHTVQRLKEVWGIRE